jgi:predicted nucleic acid-binding protein
MSTILLDTSVIFDHLNGRKKRTEFLERLSDHGHLFACCPVNITEVYAGLRPSEETKTKSFLESLEFVPITADIAMNAGLLRRDWRSKGHTLSYTDVTIAAIAITHRFPLLTDNRKHFPMPELELLALPLPD